MKRWNIAKVQVEMAMDILKIVKDRHEKKRND